MIELYQHLASRPVRPKSYTLYPGLCWAYVQQEVHGP